MTKQEIVKQIDDIEVEAFNLYRRLERLRLDLQAQWHVRVTGSDADQREVPRCPNIQRSGASTRRCTYDFGHTNYECFYGPWCPQVNGDDTNEPRGS